MNLKKFAYPYFTKPTLEMFAEARNKGVELVYMRYIAPDKQTAEFFREQYIGIEGIVTTSRVIIERLQDYFLIGSFDRVTGEFSIGGGG